MTAATPNAMLVSSTSPSGTIPTTPATVPRSAESRLESSSWLHSRSADVGMSAHVTIRRIRLMPSISSERVSWNRRASAEIFACVRIGADAGGLEPAAARAHEAAGEHFVARVLVDRVALAGEQRLVDVEPDFVAQHAVARDLVAGTEVEEIVEHDLFDRDLRDVAVADDPSARRVQALRADRACAWRAPPG